MKHLSLSKGFLRYSPLLAVMGGIFFFSHQPGGSLPLPPVPGLDKVLHALAYAVLAAAALHACPAPAGRRAGRCHGVMVVLFCVLFGAGDEIHQSFIPARTATAGDLLADAAGALFLVLAARRREDGPAE